MRRVPAIRPRYFTWDCRPLLGAACPILGEVVAIETDKTVTVSAELPGLSENDVQVEIADGVLSIRGENKAERSDEPKFVSERCYGSFKPPDSA
jgi:Hsp20/alpha crystallin family